MCRCRPVNATVRPFAEDPCCRATGFDKEENVYLSTAPPHGTSLRSCSLCSNGYTVIFSKMAAIDDKTTLQEAHEGQPTPVKHGVRFWGTFVALCCLSFISALDVAIVTTALPTVTDAVGGADKYVWIANSFVVASSVLQPLFGQLAKYVAV